MKKLSILILIASIGYMPVLTGQGVDKEVASGATIDAKDVPPVVASAMRRDFPGMKVTSYHYKKADDYREDWEITKNPSVTAEEVPYYTMYYKGKKLKGRAVYSETGELLRYHETVKDAKLPKVITDAINTKYPGAKVLKDKEVVNSTINGDAIYYKVNVKDANKKNRTLVYDTSGFLLWEN